MSFPDYVDNAPSMTLFDPLAAFLGAPEDGLLTYTFADAIRMAGHACPTVAGVWLMTVKAFEHLYEETTPERGSIQVSFPTPAQEGVTGVMANILTLVTGATTDTGFKGLGSHFDRRNLMLFAQPFDGDILFRRIDTDDAVIASYHSRTVPPAPDMLPALRQALQAPFASAHQKNNFKRLWQDRVARIFDAYDSGTLVTLSAV